MRTSSRSVSPLSSTLVLVLWTGMATASDLPIQTGLRLHLNASDSQNGAANPAMRESAGWLDTSGLGNNAVGKVSDPNWIANGGVTFNNLPVFRFDGNDAYRIGPTSNVDPLGVHGATAATIFTVINPQSNALSGSTRWFGNTGASNDYFGHSHGGGPVTNDGTRPLAGTGTSVVTNFTVSGPSNLTGVNNTHILSSVHSRFLRVLNDNGVAGTADTTDWGAATTISANSQKGVGAFENTNSLQFFYTGDIAEVIVFNRALCSAERTIVDNNLASKYNTAISGDHYAGDTPGNGNYDFNVIGVGQAADGSTVTSSALAGLQLTAVGGLGAGEEFVMAGHNVATNTLVSGQPVHPRR